MGKLSTELCKKENNTDISLYQIKLHENILKYWGLDLFKEITIGFNHDQKMTSESLASFSDGL